MKFHNQILVALLAGAATGAVLTTETTVFGVQVIDALDFVGDLFIRALQMIVVPLVTSAIISSLAGLADGRALGRLGGKTLLYYITTSTIAVLVGLVLVNSIAPGIIDGEAAGERLGLAEDTEKALEDVEAGGAGDFAAVIKDMVPPNLVEAAAQGQLLGLIVFSLLFGFFLRQVEGRPGEALRNAVEGLYETMVKITLFIIRFAPIGVFALIGAVAMRTGVDAIAPLAWFFLTVILALLIHGFVILPLALHFLARRSPVRHFQAMSPALATAFSTASSAATLPLTLECLEKRAGVSRRTSSFVSPLGATVNMDGTALFECVAVIFIAQAYGMDLGLAEQFLIVITAILTSIGVASVPAASLVAIVLILGVVGLPAEAIGLILAVDRILDMCRTAINVWGDSVGAVLIARSEGEQDVLTDKPGPF